MSEIKPLLINEKHIHRQLASVILFLAIILFLVMILFLARKVTKFLNDKNVEVLDWLSNPPHLNPIEIFWELLGVSKYSRGDWVQGDSWCITFLRNLRLTKDKLQSDSLLCLEWVMELKSAECIASGRHYYILSVTLFLHISYKTINFLNIISSLIIIKSLWCKKKLWLLGFICICNK